MFSSPELSIQLVARPDQTDPGPQPAAVAALLGIERDPPWLSFAPLLDELPLCQGVTFGAAANSLTDPRADLVSGARNSFTQL